MNVELTKLMQGFVKLVCPERLVPEENTQPKDIMAENQIVIIDSSRDDACFAISACWPRIRQRSGRGMRTQGRYPCMGFTPGCCFVNLEVNLTGRLCGLSALGVPGKENTDIAKLELQDGRWS